MFLEQPLELLYYIIGVFQPCSLIVETHDPLPEVCVSMS